MAAFPPRSTLKSGKVALRETANYPWSGDIRIEVDPGDAAEFALKLRIPGWCTGAKVAVNGEAVEPAPRQRLS